MNKLETTYTEGMKFGFAALLVIAVLVIDLGRPAHTTEPGLNEQVVVLDVQGMS